MGWTRPNLPRKSDHEVQDLVHREPDAILHSHAQPGPGCTAGQHEGPESMPGPTGPPLRSTQDREGLSFPPTSAAEGRPLAEA